MSLMSWNSGSYFISSSGENGQLFLGLKLSALSNIIGYRF